MNFRVWKLISVVGLAGLLGCQVRDAVVATRSPGDIKLNSYNLEPMSFSNNQVLIWRGSYTASDVAEIQKLSQQNDDLDAQQESESEKYMPVLNRFQELQKSLSREQQELFALYFEDYSDGSSKSLKKIYSASTQIQNDLIAEAIAQLNNCDELEKSPSLGDGTEKPVCSLEERQKWTDQQAASILERDRIENEKSQKISELRAIHQELFDIYDTKKEDAEAQKKAAEKHFTQAHSEVIEGIQKKMDILKPERLTIRQNMNQGPVLRMDWDLECPPGLDKEKCNSQFASEPIVGSLVEDRALITDMNWTQLGGILSFKLWDNNNNLSYEFVVNRVKQNDRQGRVIFMGDVTVKDSTGRTLRTGIAKFVDRSH